MPFKYTATSAERIVFTRLDSGCGQFTFIAIGSIFTLIGVGLIAFGSGIEMPFALIRFIVPVFGIFAIYAGIVLPKVQSKTTPDEIIFDNQNGRVIVTQQYSDVKTSCIYYDEVDDFIIKPKKHDSSSGSTVRSSRSYYTYHVYLAKKDGGQWELLSFNNEGDAVAEVAKLRLLVKLSQKSLRQHVEVTASKKFIIQSDYHQSELSWRNKLGYGPLFLFLFIALFLTIGYIMLNSGFLDDDFPVFAYFVVGFIGLVFVIVIGGNILKMVKHAFTTYSVVITRDRLEYVEKDNAGRIKNTKIFPIQEIHAISFSFDTDSTLRKIFIYTADQFKLQQEMKLSFNIESIKQMYTFYTQLVSLDLQDLTAVEALYVENYLQAQLKDRGNIAVK